MGHGEIDEFRKDTVRIALAGGLTRKQVADDPLSGRVMRSNVPESGWPRPTEELKDIDSDVGHLRVGRLMRQNGISEVRTRKQKVTTDSNHRFNIAPNLLDRDFTATLPNQKWAGDIRYTWTREGRVWMAPA